MEVTHRQGRENIAFAYVGKFQDGTRVEFVESWDPEVSVREKWVIIVSTLSGCPICCAFCDAGGHFERKLTSCEILEQILYLVGRRYPDLSVPVNKFKIQFARVGEPALNPALLEVLGRLPGDIHAPGLMPCISTIAPSGREAFFTGLREIKNRLYGSGAFQLQFSVHSTDETFRRRIIPARIWDLEQISHFGNRWYVDGDRRITLNFALGVDFPFDIDVLSSLFDPERFLIKITPINPTWKKAKMRLRSLYPLPDTGFLKKLMRLRSRGFTVIESLGNLIENSIGTNCGQYLNRSAPAYSGDASNLAYSFPQD
ncbi:MAG: radical SAM protein [Candidatus Glassbacteria bacterium]